MTSFFNLKTEVRIGEITQTGLGKILTEDYKDCKKIVLVDSYTNDLCLPILLNYIDGLNKTEIIEIPSGEENKTLDICSSVWETLTEYEFSRNDVLICLGGGMVCDMGGFIAALYKRGMDCIYIPTTLLAMVDASIGGKTGIDLGPLKNQLGVFSFPRYVFIDTEFLSTLPKKEVKNGYAEMLKHGLIADAQHFSVLENFNLENSILLSNTIETSLKIKNEIVVSDPQELGRRKLLNFGHTIGHAIEGLFLNSETPMDHGLAVAHGILVETKIAALMNKISTEEVHRIETCIRRNFPLQQFEASIFDQLLPLLRQDKKRLDNELRCTLLSSIGKGEWDVAVELDVVREALEVLK